MEDGETSLDLAVTVCAENKGISPSSRIHNAYVIMHTVFPDDANYNPKKKSGEAFLKLARGIETKLFENANSRAEYLDLVREKLEELDCLKQQLEAREIGRRVHSEYGLTLQEWEEQQEAEGAIGLPDTPPLGEKGLLNLAEELREILFEDEDDDSNTPEDTAD